METKVIACSKAPAALGPYSQGIQVGDFIFFSGQLGIDPAVGKLVEGCAKCQAKQALKNIGVLLEEVGATPANVVKTTVFLADMADFAGVNEVYAEFFGDTKPARSCVAVHQLPLNARVEIEVTVAK
ncbi:MAG: RidA family protein [Mailhella sp.]|nr:RidA family protein [Mailhella sp.]